MNKRVIILFLVYFFAACKLFAQSLHNQDVAFTSFGTIMRDSLADEVGSSTFFSFSTDQWIRTRTAVQSVLGYSRQNRPVEVYYFPGTSDKKALVIGGMHGSELSSIEIAKQLIGLLADSITPYYNVVVIPVLFPDNAVKAMTEQGNPKLNVGRYSGIRSVDPNRQMPVLGKPFEFDNPVDMYGRTIEWENQLLLQLIQEYAPSRIINLHAIRDTSRAGIYADPRTDCKGYALGFEPDSSLAISMAAFIDAHGGRVPGNQLLQTPTALYYRDPAIASAGSLQPRNVHGAPLPDNRGYGVSLGGWASTAVCDGNQKREAAKLITLEFPGYQPSALCQGTERESRILNIQLYASAIREIFLAEKFAE